MKGMGRSKPTVQGWRQAYFVYLTGKTHGMLKSMTGFGRSEKQIGDKNLQVEIRALNGKQLEMLLKLPPILKPYEFEIRGAISEKLMRGSVECTVTLKQNGASKPVSINSELLRSYHQQILGLSESLGLDTSNLLDTLLKLPEVVSAPADSLTTSEWESFREVLLVAMEELDRHRSDEGSALEKDLSLRIANIRSMQGEVYRLDGPRKDRMRMRLKRLMEEQVGPEKFDANRLEQELIYHIERMDITEEQVRLSNHCDYFDALLSEPTEGKGKKLGFVLQEIGREINTTGSKANDADLQKVVVMMKDELEKAKEQVLNVL
jgi:uncharacterized protein (TIGR00255 family)